MNWVVPALLLSSGMTDTGVTLRDTRVAVSPALAGVDGHLTLASDAFGAVRLSVCLESRSKHHKNE